MFKRHRLRDLCVAVGALVLLSAPLRAATYYVDDDAPGDPGPNDPAVSDPLEDGSMEHPYDRVQEALDASTSGDTVLVLAGTYREHMYLSDKDVTLASLMGPEQTILDGEGAGRVLELASGADATVDGFTFTRGWAYHGAAVNITDSSPSFLDCRFEDNEADIAPGIRLVNGAIIVESCIFRGNRAFAVGGLFVNFGSVDLRDSAFIDNSAESSPGAVGCDASSRIVATNTRFIQNRASHLSGGTAVLDGGDSVYVNCIFSRNVALGPGRGAFSSAGPEELVNCTFSGNQGVGVTLSGAIGAPTLRNCVVWGNTEGSIVDELGSLSNVTVYDSDIEGGWTGAGSGNIDADPLFVQPGTDDVRLSFGSPCVDAGNNAHVPAGVTTDIDGMDRFINGIVDMGAHEGEYDAEAPAASAYGIDPGEIVFLAPGGSTSAFDNELVLFWNVDGADDGYAVVTLQDPLHPDAGGYDTPGRGLSLETNLEAGTYWARVSMPITADDLAADVTAYAASVGNWALAVSANLANAADDDDPIGQRHEGSTPQVSTAIGDYGVVWSPALGHGFVWANVDRAGDFSFGVPLCPSDCRQPPNSVVDALDLLAMFAEWGQGAGPFDVDGDGVVDTLDLLALLAGWGACD